jgi:hypothetical protein
LRIAPRKALALRALDVLSPRAVNNVFIRETRRLGANGLDATACGAPA